MTHLLVNNHRLSNFCAGRVLARSLALFAGLTLANITSGGLMFGFNTTTLPANDDASSPAVPIGFSVNYFGTTYSTLYVNNNGNVTFGQVLSAFTPVGLTASYSGPPIIAPFFADVDTRGSGSDVVRYGPGTVGGRAAFGATFRDVGYFNAQFDKLNTFQVILVDRSDIDPGDFDIIFNYDQIQWETGNASDGSGGLGGTSAGVGYHNGITLDPIFLEFEGSRIPGSFLDGGPNALIDGSNIGMPGRYFFPVRNGAVVPEPSMYAAILGVVAIAFALVRRRRSR